MSKYTQRAQSHNDPISAVQKTHRCRSRASGNVSIQWGEKNKRNTIHTGQMKMASLIQAERNTTVIQINTDTKSLRKCSGQKSITWSDQLMFCHKWQDQNQVLVSWSQPALGQQVQAGGGNVMLWGRFSWHIIGHLSSFTQIPQFNCSCWPCCVISWPRYPKSCIIMCRVTKHNLS